MSAHVHPRDRGFTGWEECCVSHKDESPDGCAHCMVCHQWVRPHKFGEECPGKPPEPRDEVFWYGKEQGAPQPSLGAKP